jgi:pteridine reductase
MLLRGKTVLITGAARRIGRHIAKTMAKRGALLLVHYNRSNKDALSLREELAGLGAEAFLVRADFSAKAVSKTVDSFVREVYRQVPRVDVLINNASIFYPTPFGKISEADWDELMTVNLKAPFFLSQAVGKQMLKQKSGKIINIVDWAGERPYTNYLPYSISKAGLIAATKGLAKALAPHVQVAGIAPGPILPAEHADKKSQKKAAEKTLLKRYGSPEDIAETARFIIEGRRQRFYDRFCDPCRWGSEFSLMYSVTREIHFSYGHRLMNYQGKCAKLHGHNGRVQIEVSAPALDKMGMVMDFYEIRKKIGVWIDEHLDHRMILCQKDPLAPHLEKAGDPAVLMPENPTAEAIAKWIYDEARRQGLPVSKVTLWETEHCAASYCG